MPVTAMLLAIPRFLLGANSTTKVVATTMRPPAPTPPMILEGRCYSLRLINQMLP